MDIPWKVSVVAGYLSQLTGLLGGFAFAGLITCISKRPEKPEHHGIPFSLATSMLVCIFFGMLISSFLFANTAGAPNGQSLSYIYYMFASLVFSIWVLQIIFCIFLVLKIYDVPTIPSVQKLIYFGIALTVGMGMLATILFEDNVQQGTVFKADLGHVILVALMLLLIVVSRARFVRKLFASPNRLNTVLVSNVAITLLAVFFDLISYSLPSPYLLGADIYAIIRYIVILLIALPMSLFAASIPITYLDMEHITPSVAMDTLVNAHHIKEESYGEQTI